MRARARANICVYFILSLSLCLSVPVSGGALSTVLCDFIYKVHALFLFFFYFFCGEKNIENKNKKQKKSKRNETKKQKKKERSVMSLKAQQLKREETERRMETFIQNDIGTHAYTTRTGWCVIKNNFRLKNIKKKLCSLVDDWQIMYCAMCYAKDFSIIFCAHQHKIINLKKLALSLSRSLALLMSINCTHYSQLNALKKTTKTHTHAQQSNCRTGES